MNLLIHGENLDEMEGLCKAYEGMITLVYIDPPFATRNTFRTSTHRTSTMSMEKDAAIAYADTVTGEEYIDSLQERLKVAHRLLSDQGSMYVHIDCKVGYDVKVVMDRVFGPHRFRNSISRIKSNPKNFRQNGYGSIQDTVLFYTKSDEFVWNEPRIRPSPQRMKGFSKSDGTGPYTTTPLHAPGQTLDGSSGKEWHGMRPPEGRHWRYSHKKLDTLDGQGLIEWSSTGNPRLKIYKKDVIRRGVRLQDVWEFKDPQYPQYPTQKNLQMLETIVGTSSNPGDIVLDFYCGSGTSLVAAAKLGRLFMGIDRSSEAVKCARKRLAMYEFSSNARIKAAA